MANHRAPLAPGEIRSQWVGNQFFQVMHISGGSFTQATVRTSGPDRPRVLATEMFESDAVRAYADAIEQAESDAIDALEGDDTPEPLTAEGAEALAARTGFGPVPEGPYGALAAFADDAVRSAPAPTLADDVATLREMISMYMLETRGQSARTLAFAALDRIAARAPQRAMDGYGEIWQHSCGMVGYGPPNDTCPGNCGEVGTWRALYVEPDGA